MKRTYASQNHLSVALGVSWEVLWEMQVEKIYVVFPEVCDLISILISYF